MKIENIQINGFGKLKNKNIKLTDGINIIIGRNESGKSTLLKFINSMIYGISKNKRGKEISDLERYTPWETETYSGKIKYKLDDGKEFEIYRNFKNKELKIYNNFGDDITPLFSVEKNKEIPFFYEQTNVEEDLFLNSTEIIQNQIKIDKVNQNLIIQKLSNLATTGNDNISYKKSIEKLNKKQLEEMIEGINVILVDERLTTVVAENQLLFADVSRKKRKQVIDKMAAVAILQGYLDRG